jgi:adenylate kinase family enzyme
MGAHTYRRIIVVGASGSGKSTLAKRVSGSLNLDYIELDVLYREPDWKEAPPDIFRARTDEVTRAPAWVVAGDHRLARDIVWPRGDAWSALEREP